MIPASNERKRPDERQKEDDSMAGIHWERDLDIALEKARNAGKPVFLDFWFDG